MSNQRSIRAVQLQYRDDAGKPTLTGYASTFDQPYQVFDWLGEYRETVAPGAFTRSLAGNPDVRLLINHEGLPLARTKSGTLQLSQDATGLAVRAELDPSDPDVQSILPKMRRGDLGEMSFSFTVPKGGDTWNDDYSDRTIRDADINGGDVSLVTFPANPTTSASVRKKTPMKTEIEYRTTSEIPNDLSDRLMTAATRFGAPAATTTGFSQDFSRSNADGIAKYISHLGEVIESGLASEKREAQEMLPVAKTWLQFHETNANQYTAHAQAMRSISGGGTAIYTSAAEVYTPDTQTSFFQDVYNSRRGDWDAAERLSRNNAIRGQQGRALSTTAGAGGQFAPPAWLVDQWVKLARPGRITADLTYKQELQGGASSINLPKVATGATEGVQSSQNTGVSNTDITSTSVSSGITSIAGQQVVSLQLLEQSSIGFDQVILGDLAADYAKQLDLQVINGTNTSGQLLGILNIPSVPTTTFTTATPAVVSTTAANSFYNKVVSAINTINTTRYAPPTGIVMHPSRWAWIQEALDTTNRPLILTEGGAFNTVATADGVVAQGRVGTLLNLPVFVDANIPTNLGAGTNQDAVIVAKWDDINLWESQLNVQSFDAPYAASLAILFRCYAYSAFIPNRYTTSVNVISGTGLVAPTL